MRLNRLFKGNRIEGVMGLYPLTMENLLRVGLALCTILKIDRGIEKPTLCVDELNFLTMSISVGFMAGGGDVFLDGEGDVRLVSSVESGRAYLEFKELNEDDTRKIEAIIFSRYNIPRKEGEEIGKLWTRGKAP